MFEDSAALIGLLIAFLGIYLAHRLNMPALDGVASILIGLVLAVSAFLLARETKGLLLGETADLHVTSKYLKNCRDDEGVLSANGLLTEQMGAQAGFGLVECRI